MSRSALFIWVAALGVSTVALSVAGSRYVRANGASAEAFRLQAHVRTVASEHHRLVASLPDWTKRSAPSADEKGDALANRVSSTLAASGLPSSVLSSFQADGSSNIARSQHVAVMRTRAVITLDGPTLPQLGTFLTAWRAREPDYTITSIDLSPQVAPARASKNSAATTGGDAPLHAVITIESQHLEPKTKEPRS